MNKTDNSKLLEEAVEFYNLGIGEYFPISSINDVVVQENY